MVNKVLLSSFGKMKIVEALNKVYLPLVLISIFVFSVGFGGQFLPITSIALILGWVLDVVLNKHKLVRDRQAFLNFQLPFLLIFILSVLSLLYSDFDNGIKVLERRILLGIIPLMAYTGFSNKIKVKFLLDVFVVGVMLAMLFVSVQILHKVISHDIAESYKMLRVNSLEIFQNSFRDFQHRTYFGINACLAIVILYLRNGKHNWSFWLVTILITIFLLLSGGRAATLTAVVVITLLFLNTLYEKKKKYYFLLGIVICFLVFLVILIFYPRMWDAVNSLPGENTSRIFVWKTTIHTIKRNLLLGYGLGDFLNALFQQYNIEGFSDFREKSLNPHNQYLHIIGEIGMIGLFSMLWAFVGLIIWKKGRFIVHLAFVTIIALNMLFESVLVRLWGVASLSIIYIVYYNYILQLENSTEQNIKCWPVNITRLLGSFIACGLSLFFIIGVKVLDFNSNNPKTFGQGNYEIVTQLPGVKPIDFPNEARGYKLDASALPIKNMKHIHHTQIAAIVPNTCSSYKMKVYCYVSPSFNGASVLCGGYAENFGNKSYYDLTNKGNWQLLEVEGKCPDKRVGFYLQVAMTESKKIEDMTGEVIYVKPEFLKFENEK